MATFGNLFAVTDSGEAPAGGGGASQVYLLPPTQMANDPQPEQDASLSSGGLGYFSSAFGFRGGIVGASFATALPGDPSLPNSTTFGDQILASDGWLQEPGQPNGDHTTHTNPYTDDILFSLRVPAKVENGFFKTIRIEFGEASIWGNDNGYDSLDATTNYFGGWSDFVTLNLSSQFRDCYGGNDYVDKDSIAYFAGGVSGSVVVTMASGGVGFGMNASKGVVTGVLVYDGIATVDGVVSSLNNAWEGKFTVWDTLSFLPVMGYGLGKIGKAFKAPGTLGDDLADASKTLENIVENGDNFVAPVRTVDAMAETGQLGGKLYSPEKLAKLQRYLERRGIALNPARNGSFDGVKGVMELPQNPTVLNVRHELSHMLDFRKYGKDYYKKFNSFEREEMVLDRLMNNRVWNSLNEAEQSWSLLYPFTRPGGQVW